MRTSACCLALILVAPVAANAAELGVTNLLRSMTGVLSGKKEPAKQTGATSTLGIRGMDDGQQLAAAPSAEDYTLIEGWVASASEATNMAKKRELEARRVSLRAASLDSGKNKK